MTLFEPFADVPAYLLVFPVFWGAAAFFVLAMARHLRVFAAARTAGPSPFADIGARLGGLIDYAFVQTKMFRDPRRRAHARRHLLGLRPADDRHREHRDRRPDPGRPLDPVRRPALDARQRDAERRRGHRARLDRLGVLPAAGHEAQAPHLQPRRAAHPGDDRRRRRDRAARAGLRGRALRRRARARSSRTPSRCRCGALSPDVLEAVFALLWWGHIALVAAFLCYLPFSKHLHIATSFPNIWFRKLAPRGELPELDLEAEDASFGLRTLQDLGWKDLLDGFTCTECGRCQEACPAWNTGKPLNPKHFIMGIRHMSIDAEHGIDIIPNSPIVRETYGLDDTTPDATALAPPIVDDAIPYDAVWDCVTCGACVEACPVLIEHVDKIVGLRRNLVLEDSRFPQELHRGVPGDGEPGQPVGPAAVGAPRLGEAAARSRSRPWPRSPPPAALDELEVLYWVGCAAAFDARNQKVARAVATCLHAAGRLVRRPRPGGVVHGRPGPPDGQRLRVPDPRRRATSRRSTATGWGSGRSSRPARTASTRSATSTASWAASFRVVHHSTYLAELVASGRLVTLPRTPPRRPATPPGQRHRPRLVLPRPLQRRDRGAARRAGRGRASTVTEMENRGRKTFCCGAGGGRMWMEEDRGTRINAERTRQVLETGAETVATACPFCMVMLRDGLDDAAAAATARGGVTAQDISELLAGPASRPSRRTGACRSSEGAPAPRPEARTSAR